MVCYRFAVFAGLAAALPLNINLGAYSPALVVGDGEISFGGRTDVSNLINALEGAAVNAAAGATAAGAAAAAPAAAAPATEAAAAQPDAVTAAATGDPALSEQATQISALQGMGKEIAPRVTEDSATPTVAKRDLTGFDRALKYAEAALVKGPKIQLGTGGEGSGVGIIVDNNPTAAARPGKGAEAGAGAAEAAAATAAAKRDVVDESSAAPRRRAKVTTMYVRRGVPASLQASSEELSARGLAPAVPEPNKVSARSDALDSVNLNVDGDAGVTLTFVEEVDDDEDED